MTHDYKRNGTTSLFAAINTADGRAIGTCMDKPRHQEWPRFLNLVRRSIPKDKDVHITCDNYATDKHDKVKAWQKRHSRFHFHFTLSGDSWLSMVERFYRHLTERSLRRGVFCNIAELTATIEEHIAAHNAHSKPFASKTTASDILVKVKRALRKLDTLQSV